MYIYIYNLIFIILLAVFLKFAKEKFNNINTKKIFVIITCFQLIAIQGFRHMSVGTDVLGYLELYDLMKYTDFSDVIYQRMEFGFVLLVKTISLFDVNYQIYLTILSALIIVPLGYSIYKYSCSPFLSFYTFITFGFYSASFCTIRQSMAYSIILLTIDSIRKRKFWLFLLLVLIATTIHKSAVVFLPAYFLVKIKFSKINTVFLVFFTTLMFYFRTEIAEFLINAFYDYYQVEFSDSYTWVFIALSLFIIGLKVYRKVAFMTENHIYYVLILIALVLMPFATVTANAMRIVNFYYEFLIFYIPVVFLNLYNNKMVILPVYFFISFSTILYILLLTRESGYGYVPYSFFWE